MATAGTLTTMDVTRRIERALEGALASASAGEAPPTLAAAVRHAVFPGGGRIRPQLCLTVARACGDSTPELADTAAAAIELMHCASLVHDDLPCFDDASTRRGLPSVHAAFGEPLAVLAGDQLIVQAFELLARGAVSVPERLPRLIEAVARGVAMPRGIIAGQAWESERRIPITAYRRAKTGALFEAAATVGAIAACGHGSEWRLFGQRVGEAYQVADDILDVTSSASELGKPVGRDAALGRPNAVTHLGLHDSSRLCEELLRDAIDAIPSCEDREVVAAWVSRLGEKLLRSFRVSQAKAGDAPAASGDGAADSVYSPPGAG